jgi:tyrosyl-tRNA synthetase
MYGKTLSVPDVALETWNRLLLGEPPPAGLGPRDAKRALARALVARFHGSEAAEEAERGFDRVHVDGGVPEDLADVVWPASEPVVHLPALVARAFGVSRTEARRNLAQGGVRLDGDQVGNGTLDVPASAVDQRVLQLGKRRFARVRVE